MFAMRELAAIHDSRKSFYGKARVFRDAGGALVLRSYETDVARIEDGVFAVHGDYSPTTWRHVREFMRQNGFVAEAAMPAAKIFAEFGRARERVAREVASAVARFGPMVAA